MREGGLLVLARFYLIKIIYLRSDDAFLFRIGEILSIITGGRRKVPFLG